ncbi:MAG: hypothetical protein KGM47_04475 [Acidobacteriota bacterium]|nr:hypothetical protein [Acidobacteriota bacterium]
MIVATQKGSEMKRGISYAVRVDERCRCRQRKLSVRVVLRGTSPHLWRRLLVNSNITVSDFHRTLEVPLGWSGSRPYLFLIRGRIHGIEDAAAQPPVGPPSVDVTKQASIN